MSTSKRRKGKQKVSFARSESPPPGDGNVIAFPGQGPRSIRPSDPGAAAPTGVTASGRPAPGGRGSLLPDPVPDAAQRTSILEAEMADLVGEHAADQAPPAPAPARVEVEPAPTPPGSIGLAEGSQEDEDTQIGASPTAATPAAATPVPRAPRSPAEAGQPGRHALEYEDDVTAIDAAPLGSEPPPAGGILRRPETGWTDDEVTPTGSAQTVPDPDAGARAGADADDDERTQVDHEPHEQAFFDSVPPPEAHTDRFDDLATVKDELPVGDRKARNWTLGLLAAGVVVIGGFLLYQSAFVPDEEPIGAAPEPTLPDPSLLAEAAEEAEAEAEAEAGGEGAAAAVEGEAAPEATDEAEAAAEGEVTDEAGIAESLEEAIGDAPGVEPSASPEQLAAIVALPADVEVPTGTYEALLEQGREAEARNDFGGAEKLFRAALMTDPQGGDALAHLSFILLNQGDNEDARSVAEWAVALAPKNSTGWISLGAARQALGDYPGARDAYRTCVDQAEGKYVLECRRMLR